MAFFIEHKTKQFLEKFFDNKENNIQSFLFYGEDNLGKKDVALEFARAMMCAQVTKQWGGCHQCISCQNFEKGIASDLLLVEPDDNYSIKIEMIREVIDFLSYLPQIASYRTVIINQADKLTQDAQNALLKTLEESPKYSLIILITSRPKALLETVRSRLLPIRFYRSSQEEIATYLQNTFHLDSIKSQNIAELSQGKIKLAIQLLNDEYRHQLIDTQQLLDKLIKTDKLARLDLLNSILKNKTREEIIMIIKIWLERINFDITHSLTKDNNATTKIVFARNLLNAFYLINQYNVNTNLLLENIFLQL